MPNKIVNSIIFIVVIVSLVISYFLFVQKLPKKNIGERESEIICGCEISLLTAPVLIAENKGYFLQENLQVKIKEFASGRTALNSMLNEKNLDIVTVIKFSYITTFFYGDGT